jgi:hypothetical protein
MGEVERSAIAEARGEQSGAKRRSEHSRGTKAAGIEQPSPMRQSVAGDRGARGRAEQAKRWRREVKRSRTDSKSRSGPCRSSSGACQPAKFAAADTLEACSSKACAADLGNAGYAEFRSQMALTRFRSPKGGALDPVSWRSAIGAHEHALSSPADPCPPNRVRAIPA